VLFSEPKIPQWTMCLLSSCCSLRFSALQRAENSSMLVTVGRCSLYAMFQCSSASRKFLNPKYLSNVSVFFAVSVLFSEPKIPQSRRYKCSLITNLCFSALQRAENSSIVRRYRK